MSSPIPSASSPEPDPLKLFSQKLEELPNDKALSILKSVLDENPQSQLAGDLKEKVTELKGILARPMELSKEVNTHAIKILRDKMKELVERKIQSLNAKQLSGEILKEIPPHRICSFVETVEGFYHQALLEGKHRQEALTFALGKGILRSMVHLPSSDEIEVNEGLRAEIEAIGLELGDLYVCAILGTFVGLDAVYLAVDHTGNPRERYHEKPISDWIESNHRDPIDTKPRTLADIKPDLKAREVVEKKLFSLIYPELSPMSATVSEPVEALQSKACLLSLSAAHSVIKKHYEEALIRLQDSHAALEEVEVMARETINRFARLVEGMNLEEVAAPCFSGIKEFLVRAEEKLTEGNLKEIQVELISNLDTFIAFFREIEAYRSKEKALKMAGEAIGKGASKQNIDSIKEDEIREFFPGCLIGKSEWDIHLGTVENVPLPPGMFDILDQDCPIFPDKKVGQTHTLMLIPETVNGQPYTE